MPIDAWFPTFIYRAALQPRDRGLRGELKKECQRIREHDGAGRRWSERDYSGGYTSYASLSRLHKMSSTFMELERIIMRHAIRFTRHLELDLTGRELAMTDCWINIMGEAAVHSLHLHPLSTLSGVFYVTAPHGSAKIKFEDPRLSRFMAAPPRIANPRPENQLFVSYPARAGELILFESWLRHEVGSHRRSAERISISFNLNWF
jgi:uncharacterized protein (TIGR02466 family)